MSEQELPPAWDKSRVETLLERERGLSEDKQTSDSLAEARGSGRARNTLDFRTTDDNGLSFVLLVDGRPLGELIGAQEWALPFYEVLAGLPVAPGGTPDFLMVCCCSCGESGCGHNHCRIVSDGDEVVFRDFDSGIVPTSRGMTFRFSAANYDAVVARITAQAQAQPALG